MTFLSKVVDVSTTALEVVPADAQFGVDAPDLLPLQGGANGVLDFILPAGQSVWAKRTGASDARLFILVSRALCD